jgi:monoamine oxidase
MPQASYPKQLLVLYPTMPTASATLFADWPNTKFVMTGYGIPGIGEVTKIGPQQITPHRDRLYVAGEQTSMGFFGYMEGALQSGTRAARDIVLRLMERCDGSILI